MLVSLRTTAANGSTVLLSDRWTVTTGSEHTGYPATNLQQENLSQYWLAYSQRASHTWIQWASSVSSENRLISAVAVLGLNRVEPSEPPSLGFYNFNKYRVRIDRYPIASRVRPGIASISSLVNLTGTASDVSGPIDEPQVPTPVGYTPTRLESVSGGSNTSFSVTFDNHHASERPLAPGPCFFRVYAAHSANPATKPTLTVTLTPSSGTYAPGTMSTFGNTEKTANGYIFTYRFLPTPDLSDPTATLRFDVVGTAAGGGTPEYIGVELLLELTSMDYDSDDIEFSSASIGVTPNVTIPNAQTWYVFVSFSDFSTITTAFGNNTYTDIYGPLRAGRGIACDALTHSYTSPSLTFSKVQSSIERTRSGVPRSSRNAYFYGESSISLPFIPGSLLYAQWEKWAESVSYSLPFLLIPDESSADSPFFWVMLTDYQANPEGFWVGDNGTDPSTGEERWSIDLTFAQAQPSLAVWNG